MDHWYRTKNVFVDLPAIVAYETVLDDFLAIELLLLDLLHMIIWLFIKIYTESQVVICNNNKILSIPKLPSSKIVLQRKRIFPFVT